jgi:hypothetical protein
MSQQDGTPLEMLEHYLEQQAAVYSALTDPERK